MSLSYLDWSIIGLYLFFVMFVGLRYTNTAGKNLQSFFLGGRSLPWWLAGVSMVATTFAADTPLLITEIVATQGISGNWLWWNGLIGGMVATFFFARLWRRADILTDVEFSELRYAGKPAAFLRMFKAVYLGVFMNSVIMAWVNVALGSILIGFFDIPESHILYYIALAMSFVVLYTSLSGLLGVAITDFVQFLMAMSGTIILAFLVIQSPEIGGIEGLKAQLSPETFHFFPLFGDTQPGLEESARVYVLGFSTFLAFVGFQWWASWYPGAEPGGGGYIAQRMMSTRSEKDALQATLLFQIAHYALRPIPWILVGLASLVLYPDLAPDQKKMGYVLAMRDYLPDGLRGLLLAAFLAAYMSTISTQLNWGSSYLINDLYQRFWRPKADAKQLVRASRWSTLLMMVIALGVTSQIKTLESAFHFLIEAGAGLGGVLILRWYWWRINAWSEISASIAPLVAYPLARFVLGWEFPDSFFFTVASSTLAWIMVTFITAPTPLEHLQEFYKRIQPQGAWAPIRKSLEIHTFESNLGRTLLQCLAAIVMAYASLFFIGSLVFLEYWQAGIYLLIILGMVIFLAREFRRIPKSRHN